MSTTSNIRTARRQRRPALPVLLGLTAFVSSSAAVPPPPPGPATVAILANKSVPDGSFDWPAGAIHVQPAPQSLRFSAKPAPPTANFAANYTAHGGARTGQVITQRFAMSSSLAAVQAGAAAARDGRARPDCRDQLAGLPARRSRRRPSTSPGSHRQRRHARAEGHGATWRSAPAGSGQPTARRHGANTVTAVATDAAATRNRRSVFTGAIRRPRTRRRGRVLGGVGSKIKLKTLLKSGIKVKVAAARPARCRAA